MPGRAREEAWKEKERGQENRQAEGGEMCIRDSFPRAAHGKIGAWEGTRRGTENAEGLEENRN